MRLRTLGVTAAAALALAACGSDDGGGTSTQDDDGGGSSTQDEVAVLFVDAMEAQDIAVDLDCTKEAASGLSDEDAQELVDAGVGASSVESPGAAEFAATATSCIDISSLVDLFGEDLVDGDCLEEVLKNVDPADLAPGDLFPAEADACFSG